ncbi:MAG TPA: hypothetical protein VFG76_11940, partial [Candidatus Polarisedimenticolia bacterium]|nr:hypothetical protein [Candidatus Polarisedimenticolia bacterium]
MRPRGAPLAAAGLLAFLAFGAARAQTGGLALETTEGGRWRPGEVVERIACLSDPSQSYALYLPPRYDAGRGWPVVFLMDPRGRALVPLELFKDAAGRLGYILISSYDTASDGPRDTNAPALTAMLADARRRFSVDARRFYLAGFSGTARSGWEFSVQLAGKVAGLMGFGGGLPEGFAPSATMTFVFFGGAGTTDFNYEEMRALEVKLASIGIPHRFAWYDGPHSWPPAEV